MQNNTRKYNKHLYIKCKCCGHEKSFFTKEKVGEAYCNSCGNVTPFEGQLVPLWLHCECGMRVKYYTNVKEPLFDAKCLSCGAPVAVEWNASKRVYATIREKE